MKLLLDACLASRRLEEALQSLGHDVKVVRGGLAHASDEEVLALANREGRVLVTEDKDFGTLIFLRHFPHPCVVRLVQLTIEEQVSAMRDLLGRGHAFPIGAVFVVTRKRVRERRTGDSGGPPE